MTMASLEAGVNPYATGFATGGLSGGQRPRHPSARGVASFVCAVAFLLYWSWKRAVFNALLEECRHFVVRQLASRIGTRPPVTIPTPADRPAAPAPRTATA